MTTPEDCPMNKFEKPPWHMDKSVSLGTMFAILAQSVVFAVGLVTWGNGIEARIAVLESQRVTDSRVASIEKDVTYIRDTQKLYYNDIKEIKDTLNDMRAYLRSGREEEEEGDNHKHRSAP